MHMMALIILFFFIHFKGEKCIYMTVPMQSFFFAGVDKVKKKETCPFKSILIKPT